ncbi:MAG TPA: M48 family metallopeptidase [Steroidobacteraceae bacterium]|nr:M48 family metallopeptidase [Steroidobacteraceae bacterium]
MDFYARQAAARGQTRWLVLAFVLSLLAVALALDLVLFSFLASAGADRPLIEPLQFAQQNPGVAVFSTLIVMGVLGLASLYKTMELRGGGGVVARSLGGVLVSPDTTDLKRKRLLNVVSEMAIASGVPMPEVYVLEQELAINAFAAGHTAANAAITVTQGALDQLNRDQLQGVIGHEFSHILNGDMRLNVQLMGWVFGLFVVALIGRLLLNFSPRNRRGNNGIVALAFAIVVLGYVGLFLGRLMQAAVSRQRERLADASGVQFTRNPQGLKEALVKIAVLPEGSRLSSPHAEQAAHMFFAEGLDRLFATHPPLMERIRELDPHFDERELARMSAELEAAQGASEPPGGPGSGELEPAAAPGARPSVRVAPFPAAGSVPGPGVVAAAAGISALASEGTPTGAAATAQPVVSRVGRVDAVHIRQAQAIQLAMPEGLTGIMQSPGKSQAFVLALLLSQEPPVRERQLAILGQALSVANFAVVQQLTPLADGIEPLLRLPVLQQLFPALRRAPVPQRKALAQLVNELIHADNRIDAFEFSLAKLFETLINDELQARVPHGTLSLEDAQNEIHVLFATLAQLGAQNAQGARMAYEAGMSGVLPMRRPAYAELPDWPRQLSEALTRLDQLHPFAKKVVIDGLVKTIASDDVMNEAEAELLRTVCALMHCPLPPLLGGPVQA